MAEITFFRPFEIGSAAGPFQFVARQIRADLGEVTFTGPNGFVGVYRIRNLTFVDRPFDIEDRFDVTGGTIVRYHQSQAGLDEFEILGLSLDAVQVIETPPRDPDVLFDLFYGGADVITGSDGNDTLLGFAGRDTIHGGRGNDRIDGSLGNDRIVGGSGHDTLIGHLGRDILSGLNGADRMFGGEGRDRLQGGGQSDTLFGGGGRDVLRGEDGRDSLLGAQGNDALYGGAGNDRLFGQSGHDSLRGGTGSDVMRGGGGNDTYFVDDENDRVVELVGKGTDQVVSFLASYSLAENVEHLTLMPTLVPLPDRTGVGNALGNLIVGDVASRNGLRGGAGDDTLIGAALDDDLRGENGHDSIEGQSGHDFLFGGAGRDTLVGGEGDDTLNGGGSADFLFGGVGNDVYIVHSSTDILTEEPGGGVDEVQTSLLAYTLQAEFENLRLLDQGREGIILTGTGNSGNNQIFGSQSVGNILSGAAGNDTLFGGLHGDTLFGGDSDDLLQGNRGNDSLNGGAGLDSLLGGDGDDTLDGGEGDNTLTGGLGNDLYLVSSHTDVLLEDVGAGVDTVRTVLTSYTLGDNFDRLELLGAVPEVEDLVGVGNELHNEIFGSSADRNDLFGELGEDTLRGGALDDHLFGGEGDDLLEGGDGHDSLSGGLGQDTLLGGLGDDFLSAWFGTISDSAGDGGNFLDGGEGNDTLQGGGGGREVFFGGLGADVLLGGARDPAITVPFEDPDRFVFRSVEESRSGFGNRDSVQEFETGFSQIDLTEFQQAGVRIDLAISTVVFDDVGEPAAVTNFYNVFGLAEAPQAEIILHISGNEGQFYLMASTYDAYWGHGVGDLTLDTDFEVEILSDTDLIRADFLLGSDLL